MIGAHNDFPYRRTIAIITPNKNTETMLPALSK
jgi:hypothetical protein